jgi:hypothetical protein
MLLEIGTLQYDIYRMVSDNSFVSALKDYLFLLDKGYPARPSLQLVGNRYRLSRDKRNALFRGICPSSAARQRSAKRDDAVGGRNIYVDGYNVLYTIYNYLTGRPLFISSDRFLRDTGAGHGRIANPEVFSRSIEMLQQYLQMKQPRSVRLFLDKAVRESPRHKQKLDAVFSEGELSYDAALVASADRAVLDTRDGSIATSDSVIIDKTDKPVIDLARMLLEEVCRAEFCDFSTIL